MTKQQINAICYVAVSMLTPIAAALASDQPLAPRACAAVAVGALAAGANTLKAFLSSPQNPPPDDIPLTGKKRDQHHE